MEVLINKKIVFLWWEKTAFTTLITYCLYNRIKQSSIRDKQWCNRYIYLIISCLKEDRKRYIYLLDYLKM